MSLTKSLVIFDIDGTLITGKHGHPKSYGDAIKVVHNIDFEVDWKGVQGMTDQEILTDRRRPYSRMPADLFQKTQRKRRCRQQTILRKASAKARRRCAWRGRVFRGGRRRIRFSSRGRTFSPIL